MTYLLDGNLLVALTAPEHVHHEAAHSWWSSRPDAPFATSPITQGTLLRVLIRQGAPTQHAVLSLRGLTAPARHVFWADDVSYLDTALGQVRGHRQVTDAYLAALARHHGGRIATFDKGLAASHPDVSVLVPTAG